MYDCQYGSNINQNFIELYFMAPTSPLIQMRIKRHGGFFFQFWEGALGLSDWEN